MTFPFGPHPDPRRRCATCGDISPRVRRPAFNMAGDAGRCPKCGGGSFVEAITEEERERREAADDARPPYQPNPRDPWGL